MLLITVCFIFIALTNDWPVMAALFVGVLMQGAAGWLVTRDTSNESIVVRCIVGSVGLFLPAFMLPILNEGEPALLSPSLTESINVILSVTSCISSLVSIGVSAWFGWITTPVMSPTRARNAMAWAEKMMAKKNATPGSNSKAAK